MTDRPDNPTPDASLPEGWVRTTLGAIRRDASKGIEPARTPDRQFELYSVPSFPSGMPETVEGKAVGSNKQTVGPDTVLVCKINPRINRIWVVGAASGPEQIASTEWIPFWPVEGVFPHYLCYYLQQHAFRDHLAASASGVGGSLMRVKAATLAAFPLLLPPIDTQRAIAAHLDELFTDLDAGVAALQRARAKLKRYRASVLKAAVEGRLTAEWRREHLTTEHTESTETSPEKANKGMMQATTGAPDPASVVSVPSVVRSESGPELLRRILAERRQRWEADQLAKFAKAGKTPPKGWQTKYAEPKAPDTANLPPLPEGWCWATVEQMGEIGTGATPRRGEAKYWAAGTVPWVTSAAVNAPFVDSAEERVTPLALEESNLTLYPEHTLIIAMYGEGKTRGKVSELLLEATTNQALAAIQVGECAPVVRTYLKMFLQSQYEGMRRLAAGGVQPNLNLGLVRQIAVSLPPAAEQQQIVAEVERRLSVADDVEAQTEADLKRAARLRHSILKLAFDGRLSGSTEEMPWYWRRTWRR